ncbi:cupredoxin domain-containing protein [Candidatus Woesearchaeota archaeon]|nr:cupredoxin domain-containing protein [Candidatus Woesearchaeota archaeon]
MAGRVQRLLRRAWFPLLPRVLALLGFLPLLALLTRQSVSVFGISITDSIPLLIVWTLWWPLLYLLLIPAGRAWCGFLCPVGLANEAGNELRSGKALRIARWSFLAYVVFFAAVILEQVTGLFLSPKLTLLLLGGALLLALAMGALWSRWSFCRLICPVGTLFGVFSRLSAAGIRTERALCAACRTKECLTGVPAGPCPAYNHVPTLDSNKECLLCARCVKNCPHGSAQLRLLLPGQEILDRGSMTLAESLFIIGLLGMAFILTTSGTLSLRGLVPLGIRGPGLRALDFLLGLSLFLLAFLALSALSSRLSMRPLREHLTTFGYIHLPLVFLILTFSVVFGFLAPWLPLGEGVISATKYLLVIAGLVWGLALLAKLGRSAAERIPHGAALLAVSALWVLLLIPGPLAARPVPQVFVAQPGQPVRISAFSMGFDPAVIEVRKDEPVMLEIANMDIAHAFDIDELGVHSVVLGGKDAHLTFTPRVAGNFTMHCSIPGHAEAGMRGTLVVR